MLTRGGIDDRQLLLWRGKHVDLRHGDDDADRIHASKIFFRCGIEQFGPQYIELHGRHRRSATHRCDWQWLALYYPWSMGIFKRIRHIRNPP